jgi:hypothetical protein
MFLESFSFWESGDGKGRVDVHFSYKNRKCLAWVENGNNLLSPMEFAAALSGGFKSEGCIPNSTVRLLETAVAELDKKDFPLPVAMRNVHCVDFEEVTVDSPAETIVCKVRETWISPVVDSITKKRVDQWLEANPSFRSPVVSELKREVTAESGAARMIGPVNKRMRKVVVTTQKDLCSSRAVELMQEQTIRQLDFQQLNGDFTPVAAFQEAELAKRNGLAYAVKRPDRRPAIPQRIAKKLDDMVRSNSRQNNTVTILTSILDDSSITVSALQESRLKMRMLKL